MSGSWPNVHRILERGAARRRTPSSAFPHDAKFHQSAAHILAEALHDASPLQAAPGLTALEELAHLGELRPVEFEGSTPYETGRMSAP